MINETDFKNLMYKGLIGELERRESYGLHKGNAHHLANNLSCELWEAYQQSAVVKREQTQHEAAIEATNNLQRDIDDINGYMEGIDIHIHWLGSTLPAWQTETPEFKAVLDRLQSIEATLRQMRITLKMGD